MQILTMFSLLIIIVHKGVLTSSPSAEKVTLLDTIQDDWRGWTTNSGKYSGWRSQNIPPNGDRVFGLCMVMRENNDNWLYSPIIATGEANSIIIETYFSMRNCRNYPEPSKLKSCEEKINMLTFETDEMKESSSLNNKFFKQTAVLFPEKKWSQTEQDQPTMNFYSMAFSVKTLGIQLGYRDTGSCTMIRRVRAYYLVCPSVVTSFMEFPRTVTKHGYDLASAQGACVNGAVSKHVAEIQNRFCQSNGMWHEIGTENCHCAPGYTPSNDWKSCIPCAKGTYKATAGVDRCSYCPKYSQSQPGQKRCQCDKDFYKRIVGSGPLAKTLCIQPPKGPEELTANVTDGNAITLTWKYPQLKEDIMRDDIEYFQVSCSNCAMDQLVISPSINVTQLSVTIVGLNMGENYIFFVTSMASAFNQTSSKLFSSTRSAVFFSLPKTNGLAMTSAQIYQNENSTITISWTKPADIHVNLYMLQICSVLFLTSNISKAECEYQFTIANSHLFSPNTRCTQLTVRIRFKSKGNWSDYSSGSTIRILQRGNINSKVEISNRMLSETSSTFQWLPNLEVILLFVTSGILIIILLSVSVVLMRRHVYRTMKQNDCNLLSNDTFIDNTKSSYASITASSPSRGRSYFYLASVDSNIGQHSSPDEIPPELIIMKSLDSKGQFYDTFTACLKQHLKLPLKVTLYVLKTNAEVNKSLLEDVYEIAQFQHDNIVSIIGVCSISKPQVIISQYMAHGSLNNFLKCYQSTIDKSQLLLFLRDIACGLCYLAERKFIIKRLTTHRVYIDDSFVCKCSIVMRDWPNEIQSSTESRNEIGWTAPELYSQNVHTGHSDVWIFGVIMWEVFSFGEPPYWNWTDDFIKKSVLDGYRLPPPNNCLSPMHDLMLQCWSTECSQRPSFSMILTKMEISINYVDDKQLMSASNQQFITSADSANHIDDPICNKMMNSYIENAFQFPDNHRNASLDNITDQNNFYSIKQTGDYLSIKRTNPINPKFPTTNFGPPNKDLSSKSIDNLTKRRRSNESKLKMRCSTLQKHIKGPSVNLNSWLSEINMKKYKGVMIRNGYNNRSKLVNVSIADLTEMGIRNASEIQILINNIQQLRSKDAINF